MIYVMTIVIFSGHFPLAFYYFYYILDHAKRHSVDNFLYCAYGRYSNIACFNEIIAIRGIMFEA
jgi:hypothetical protein